MPFGRAHGTMGRQKEAGSGFEGQQVVGRASLDIFSPVREGQALLVSTGSNESSDVLESLESAE